MHRVIYDELVLGVVRDESRAAYARSWSGWSPAAPRAIVLGCTEIELLVGADDSPVPVFPTTQLHVDAALDAALA